MSDLLPSFLQRAIWLPIRAVYRHFLNFKIKGLEQLESVMRSSEGVLFVSNHLSELDPTFIPAALPFFSRLLPMHYVSLSKEHYAHLKGWRIVAGGLIFRIWGAYPAILGVKDFGLSLAEHIRLLEAGKSVCIFPEGGICRGQKTGPARPGVSYLAFQTKAVLVPVYLEANVPLSLANFFGRRLTLEINFGTPFTFAELCQYANEPSLDDHKLAATSIMSRVYALKPEDDAL